MDRQTYTQEIKKYVVDLYNQTFLRFRSGGMYLSNQTKNSEIFIRIASTGFNWFDIIWKFVYENKTQISDVTIVRDNLAVGKCGYYKIGQYELNHLPIDDFITLS